MRCKISVSLLPIVYLSRYQDRIGWSKFLLESALECPCIYYAPPLLRGTLHLVRDTATEKEFGIAIFMTLELTWVSSEIQENRYGRRK